MSDEERKVWAVEEIVCSGSPVRVNVVRGTAEPAAICPTNGPSPVAIASPVARAHFNDDGAPKRCSSTRRAVSAVSRVRASIWRHSIDSNKCVRPLLLMIALSDWRTALETSALSICRLDEPLHHNFPGTGRLCDREVELQ